MVPMLAKVANVFDRNALTSASTVIIGVQLTHAKLVANIKVECSWNSSILLKYKASKYI